MGDKPIWEQIGSSFVQHYYQLFDADRTQLGAIYIPSWPGTYQAAVRPYRKARRGINAQVLVHRPPLQCGYADEDPIMGFHQIFLLKNINDAWVCTNDMFRLALHNFG
uniref:NTF2 domain-containing protein n=1 Tax=Amazona collaria TaxID=241587 RepID=A0A8B9G6R3_9PSIT